MVSLRNEQARCCTIYPPTPSRNANQKLCQTKFSIDEYPLLKKDFGSSDTYDIPVSLARTNAESSTAADSRSVSSDPSIICTETSAETTKNISLGLAVVPSTFAPDDIIMTKSSLEIKERLESVLSSDPPTEYEMENEPEQGSAGSTRTRNMSTFRVHSCKLQLQRRKLSWNQICCQS